MTVIESTLVHKPVPPDEHCNARKDDGTLCEQRAGWGTTHPGEGRCKLHGGSSLRGPDHPNYKHGRRTRYDKALKAQLADAYAQLEDDDAFDIADELRLQRALLLEFINGKDNVTASDRQQLMAWSETISKTAERMTRMRNDTALTAAELKLIAARLADVVSRHIAEPDRQAAFLADLFASIGMSGSNGS
jgi:hypothetical protein